MFESLFQFLFDYRPHVFRQAEFRFSPPAGVTIAAAVIIAALVLAFVGYRLVRTRLQWREQAILGALRLAGLALILFCIFRPVLIVRAAVSQQNVIGVLIDDSRSMQIADAGGRRADFARQTFGQPDSPTMKALADRFLIRTFRFSSSTTRMSNPAELTFGGTQTRLAGAIQSARQELAGLPVSGLILVTDGADTTTDASVADALLASKADALPVFTVGVGRETLAHDIQIGRVSTPRTALKGTSLLVDAIVTQTGYAGQTVTLDVEDGGRIVGSQPVRLPADGDPAAVRVRFTASDAGPRLFHLRISPQPGEVVTENNQRDVQIDVRDRRERILYFEGEPRFEMKFLRRAIADDPNLQLVTLQRTAENKYLRLSVDKPEELVAGFPKTREELFAYRGIVLGSVEASAFTGDQLRMISEFVDVRGGGLLLLGGPHAFGEGGYAGTAVADAMPVLLERPVGKAAATVAHVKVRPTRAGEAHAVTQLGDTEEASADRWKTMPALTRPEHGSSAEAGRYRAPVRDRRAAARADRARLSALWTRQVDCLPRARLLALADALVDPCRRSDARKLLAADVAVARGRRTGRRRVSHADGSCRSRPAGDADGRRRRFAIRRAERRGRDGPCHVSLRHEGRRSARVDR